MRYVNYFGNAEHTVLLYLYKKLDGFAVMRKCGTQFHL